MTANFVCSPAQRIWLKGSLNELLVDVTKHSNRSDKLLWIGITGSWRLTNYIIEKLVRESVAEVMRRGHGIVSGGALGVDYFATDEAMKIDKYAKRIKIILPVSLEEYKKHYLRRATEGVISKRQALELILQLESLQRINSDSVIELKQEGVNKVTYYERNTEVVRESDAILGFQVNDSAGAGDTILKACDLKKPVYVKKFAID